MNYFGIATIIFVVVWAVHFVHKHAFRDGHILGISVGRRQILEENLIRSDSQECMELSTGMWRIVNNLTKEIEHVHKPSHKSGSRKRLPGPVQEG